MRRLAIALFVLVAAACGSVPPAPAPVGTPLTVPQLKFAVMDAVGKPVYCDRDFYPVARGDEQAKAVEMYPQIQADTETYAAILAHEGLPSGNLSDPQKLAVYRAWKLLGAVVFTQAGNDFSFQYRVQSSATYQMVGGTVHGDGKVNVTSRQATGPPACPICLAASTLIATPDGPLPVIEIAVGTMVWTQAADGSRVAAPVIEIGSMPAPAGHQMVHLVLADGRELLASPGHRTADGRPLGGLKVGDSLDGSVVVRWELVPYAGERTYDLLPAGATGHYWANGIELSSTLQRPR